MVSGVECKECSDIADLVMSYDEPRYSNWQEAYKCISASCHALDKKQLEFPELPTTSLQEEVYDID